MRNYQELLLLLPLPTDVEKTMDHYRLLVKKDSPFNMTTWVFSLPTALFERTTDSYLMKLQVN